MQKYLSHLLGSGTTLAAVRHVLGTLFLLLEVARGGRFDLALVDLKMPGIDGIEVLRRVKQDYPEVEVIILTGHGSDAEEKLAEEIGAFAYLRKPVDIEVLAETMKAAYRKVQRAGSEDLEE